MSDLAVFLCHNLKISKLGVMKPLSLTLEWTTILVPKAATELFLSNYLILFGYLNEQILNPYNQKMKKDCAWMVYAPKCLIWQSFYAIT